MQFSYSRVSTFEQCPRKFKYHYIDELTTIPDLEPDNALIVGSALHLGIEKGYKAAEKYYCEQYPVISDAHVNELIKLEILIPKVQEILESFNELITFEYEIDNQQFKGYVDCLVGKDIIFDFKYSNNIKNYLESAQLHLYKYFLELKTGISYDKLGFIFIPKTSIRQKKTEDLYQFRKRLIDTVEQSEIKIEYVEYDFDKVISFFETCKEIVVETDYTKQPSRLCDWCSYQKYCGEELDYMLLPENKRREVKINTMPDMWLYGDSYSGKTVFMDSFDNVLMLNTDGNIDHISSPVLRIKDEITVEGRLTNRKFAWEVFQEAVAELEKKENDFKTIVIDLVEDVFEHCRLYMYNKLNIQHEQDAGFGKGYDLIRTQFLSCIKRLKNCGYQIVYISKVSISEITKRNGEKVTVIKPNVNEKISNVLSGTVDLTARVVADEDERKLCFKTSPYIFGGSRYNFGAVEIKLDKEIFLETLKNAQGIKVFESVADMPNARTKRTTNKEEN